MLDAADIPASLDALRDRHEEIHVIGSVDLVQTILSAGVFDELKLWMYPLVLGTGKRVFPEGIPAQSLRLIAPAVTGPTGTILLRYAPAGPWPAQG